MSVASEPLVEVMPEHWHQFQDSFRTDWPRGAPGYYLVDTQLSWWRGGLGPCMRIYCPYGDVTEGMVAINEKADPFSEVIILSTKDEPAVLEEALVGTSLIDWKTPKMVPFAPVNIQRLLRRLTKRLDIVIHKEHKTFGFMRKKESKIIEVQCPEDLYFDKLTLEHVKTVNDNWPHRRPGSEILFENLIRAGQGFGLFRRRDGKLLSWLLRNESGFINHLCCIEEFRRNGYAELLGTHTSNNSIREGKDTISYTVFGNWSPVNMNMKLGRDVFGIFVWTELMPKRSTGTVSKL